MKLETENEKPQILQSTFQWNSKNRCCSVKRNEWKTDERLIKQKWDRSSTIRKYKSQANLSNNIHTSNDISQTG